MKAELKVINGKLNNTEHVSDLEDRIMEITQSEYQKERWKKWKQHTRTLE